MEKYRYNKKNKTRVKVNVKLSLYRLAHPPRCGAVSCVVRNKPCGTRSGFLCIVITGRIRNREVPYTLLDMQMGITGETRGLIP